MARVGQEAEPMSIAAAMAKLGGKVIWQERGGRELGLIA